MLYSRVLFQMTLSELEWLSEIFNDTKHRGLSATAELLVLLVIKILTINN